MRKSQPDPASKVTRAFASRLKAARVAAGFETQKAFAEHINSEAETYRRWERAETEPPFHMLVKIRHAVGKSVDFLICGPNDGNS